MPWLITEEYKDGNNKTITFKIFDEKPANIDTMDLGDDEYIQSTLKNISDQEAQAYLNMTNPIGIHVEHNGKVIC